MLMTMFLILVYFSLVVLIFVGAHYVADPNKPGEMFWDLKKSHERSALIGMSIFWPISVALVLCVFWVTVLARIFELIHKHFIKHKGPDSSN